MPSPAATMRMRPATVARSRAANRRRDVATIATGRLSKRPSAKTLTGAMATVGESAEAADGGGQDRAVPAAPGTGRSSGMAAPAASRLSSIPTS